MKQFQLLLLSFFITSFLFGQSVLPIQSGELSIKPLGSLLNKELQNGLELELNKNPKWKKLIQQNKLAVGVIDLSNQNNIEYARINGNNMMYAASLPKIAVLLAAMDAIEKGELKETPEVVIDMKIMISKSSNQAATRMIDRLGFDKIESVLTDETSMTTF